MLKAATIYMQQLHEALQRVLDTQSEAIDQASSWIAESLQAGGVLHVFGSGHSHMMGEELTYRAGGLAPVNPVLDINLTLLGGPPSFSTNLERLEGYTATLMDSYIFHPGEVIIINSQSGINPGPVEVALAARELGLKVVAVTSIRQSAAAKSRHSSGSRLFELADLAIDNCVPVGDACVEIGGGLKAAPLSTAVTVAILESIVAEVAARIQAAGKVPPIWVSANVPGGDEHNEKLKAAFPARRKVF
jgi:uncharacterized phosphosugar-binding protein